MRARNRLSLRDGSRQSPCEHTSPDFLSSRSSGRARHGRQLQPIGFSRGILDQMPAEAMTLVLGVNRNVVDEVRIEKFFGQPIM